MMWCVCVCVLHIYEYGCVYVCGYMYIWVCVYIYVDMVCVDICKFMINYFEICDSWELVILIDTYVSLLDV